MTEAQAWKKYQMKEYMRVRLNNGWNWVMEKAYMKKYKHVKSEMDDLAGKPIMGVEATSEYIAKKIMKQKPFFAGRYGATEFNMIVQALNVRYGRKEDNRKPALCDMCLGPGFFPKNMRLAEKFVDLMLEEIPNIDLHGIWPMYMEEYIIDRYEKNVRLTTLENLEPFRVPVDSQTKPWSYALAGKKVLVVHPFVETIRKQYDNYRENIFSRVYNADDILPEFELKTLKAVQTIAGNRDIRFRTWFDALDWMKEECARTDFDVAIIGCGGYGFPLASEIKRMGKIAIHLGGATQLLFGIKGRRWEDPVYEWYPRTVNESWVRPNGDERVNKLESIENGCYW